VRPGELFDVRLAAGARLFAIVALGVPAVLSTNVVSIVGLLILATVWMTGLAVRGVRSLSPLLVITFEAIAVGVTLGAARDGGIPLMGALALAPLMAGVRGGLWAVLQAIGAEILAFVVIAYQGGGSVSSEAAGTLATWIVAGLGFGLIASFARATRLTNNDELTPYRDARALISQLLELSGDLHSGLDAVSISQRVINSAREEIPFVGGVVYIRRGEALTPLIESAESAGLDTPGREALVEHAWASGQGLQQDSEIAFPLRTDAGVVAVVAGALPATLDATDLSVERALHQLTERLSGEALQLDTALLFAAVRDEATAEERRRLAREVHDGVAQDVASLGYLVDDLEDSATTPEQAEVFRQLRGEITSVVAELRRSVFSLRNEASSAGSLGESVSALARHVTTVTGTPVHVILDEGSTRLRTEVEAELLRIAQEAMNNAVRHGRPQNVWVSVRVQAPGAEIEVRDDGVGLQSLRHDSHGVRIMNERARLIGASFELHNADTGGTIMRVRIDRMPVDASTKE